MSKSIALLAIAAFALSAPLHARTLLDAAGDSRVAETQLAIADVSAEASQPICGIEAAAAAAAAEALGGMPDTGAAKADAQVTACCWFYHMGRWWCVPCY
jgi:hypothetical protein